MSNGSFSHLNRIVNVTEINQEQALFNTQYNDSFASQIINGELQLCSPGCQDCDCSSCLANFVFDSTTSSCKPCAPGCLTCNADDISLCLTCSVGTFFNASTSACEGCSSSCFSCDGSAAACRDCLPGEYFSGVQCEACAANCEKCTNSTCTTCRKGFTVTSLGECRGCSISCSACNPLNITECTACAAGLQLLNGKCDTCPENCLQCNGNACGSCVKGYTTNSNSVCILKCQLPCVKCADGQPTVCTTCQLGSSLVNSQCILNTTCNSDNSCTYCGQGLGYFYVPTSSGGYCSQCPTIANCAQCNENSAYSCAVCKNGFFV